MIICNKIIIRIQLKVICFLVFLWSSPAVQGQDTTLNKYGLWVIGNTQQLQRTVLRNPSKKMVDLAKKIPGIIIDLRYAGSNNFMRRRLYPSNGAWLRSIAADSLAMVQTELNKYGYGLKIWDAYRPYSVTELMWEPVRDDRYAADPKKGSGHNRGIAVDLTLVDLASKAEIDMGTGFDNFSDTAHHGFKALSTDVLRARTVLKLAMEKHGFKALDTEWWHYYFINGKDFELLDLNFEQLSKLK
jgi:D-alanyl-D-alanine dipeptidase